MGRYIAPTLNDLVDVTVDNATDGQSMTFNATSEEWVKGDTLEKNANKDAANGYAGLDANGDLNGGVF